MQNQDNQIWHWSVEASGELRLSGEIDFTCIAQVRDLLKQHIEAASTDLTLDLGHLEYIDSSGVSLLIEMRKILARQSRGLKINQASEQVLRILRLTHMHGLFGLPD